MTIRTALVCLVGVLAVALWGCDESTDVSKKVNDDYHAHVPGPPPAAGAMKAKGPPVGPFVNSGGVPPGTPTGAGRPASKGPTKPTGK